MGILSDDGPGRGAYSCAPDFCTKVTADSKPGSGSCSSNSTPLPSTTVLLHRIHASTRTGRNTLKSQPMGRCHEGMTTTVGLTRKRSHGRNRLIARARGPQGSPGVIPWQVSGRGSCLTSEGLFGRVRPLVYKTSYRENEAFVCSCCPIMFSSADGPRPSTTAPSQFKVQRTRQERWVAAPSYIARKSNHTKRISPLPVGGGGPQGGASAEIRTREAS